jgi:F-type H+-transporting ATPase subunit b
MSDEKHVEGSHPSNVTHTVDALLEEGGVQHHAEVKTASHEKAGMPQLDVTTFPSQIFWLVVTFSLLYVLISKSALPRIHEIMDKRRSRIENDVSRAEQLSKDAAKAQKAYEEMHRRAKDKASHVIAESLHAIRHKQETEMAKADAAVVAMLNKAEVAVQERQASLRTEMVAFSESLASRVVEELTGKTPDAAWVKTSLA